MLMLASSAVLGHMVQKSKIMQQAHKMQVNQEGALQQAVCFWLKISIDQEVVVDTTKVTFIMRTCYITG